MTDPFAQDAQRRRALMERVEEVRLALYLAHVEQDGAAALQALADTYKLLDRIEGSQLLFVGEQAETSVAFALPNTCVQMVSRYGGICILCDDRIGKGEIFYWDKSDRSMTCARCSVKELTGQR